MKYALVLVALFFLVAPVSVFSSEIDMDFMIAVKGGRTAEAQALLASGADVNKKYEYDYTALKYAKQNEDDEIV